MVENMALDAAAGIGHHQGGGQAKFRLAEGTGN
jgi:hypothetical protein